MRSRVRREYARIVDRRGHRTLHAESGSLELPSLFLAQVRPQHGADGVHRVLPCRLPEEEAAVRPGNIPYANEGHERNKNRRKFSRHAALANGYLTARRLPFSAEVSRCGSFAVEDAGSPGEFGGTSIHH